VAPRQSSSTTAFVLLVSFLALPAISSAQSLTITEYNLSTPGNYPLDIITGPDGALWFTEGNTLQPGSRKIGRITSAGVITEYAVDLGAGPFGITVGSDGALWFSETDKIGRITTAGSLTEYAGPPPYFGSVFGIAPGPDGALWFCETAFKKIGRITTAGVITEFTIPTPSSGSVGITNGPDGALWFREGVGKIGRITTDGVVTEYPIPGFTNLGEGNGNIVAGPDGALWFTEAQTVGVKIWRITTSGVVTAYPLLTSSLYPVANITVGPDGAVWATGPNTLVRVSMAGVVTEYTLPFTLQPQGITAGPDGALWFADGNGKIGRAATAPTLNVSLSPNVLWPPDHKLAQITATIQASDICDTNPSVVLVSITSNEPDNGLGDGDEPNDIQGASFGTDDRSFFVRAERSGTGTGRIYTVTYKATDADCSGNMSFASAQVRVPLDQRP
jgi:virginiamycin B lyase